MREGYFDDEWYSEGEEDFEDDEYDMSVDFRAFAYQDDVDDLTSEDGVYDENADITEEQEEGDEHTT